MLTLIIILVLGTGFYAGYRRGFALQLVYFAGYAISFMLAQKYYKVLGKKISLFVPFPAPTIKTTLALFDNRFLFDMDKAFYAALGFVLILLLGWLVTRFVGMLSYGLTFVPIVKQGNSIIGGILNLVVTLVGCVAVLTLLAMIPMDAIQQMIKKDFLAHELITKTPIISDFFYNWWITKTIL